MLREESIKEVRPIEETKIGDRLQVWDDKKHVYIGWGEIISFGVGCKTGIPLVEVGNGFIWGDEFHCIPEKKALEIAERIKKDLEEV